MFNFRKNNNILKNKKIKQEGSIIEFFRTIIYAVLIAIVFRSFLFEPYNIPSGSMLPNLLVGDYLFVSKYSYGFSRYSFPFGIVPLPKRIWVSYPQRGDVAVFKLPSNTSINYIKRVIGIPGDTVQMKAGKLFLNDKLVIQNSNGVFNFLYKNKYQQSLNKFEENLTNKKSYSILNKNDFQQLDNTRKFYVPEDHYFMMGDNRDNSLDSRADVGFVPFENFVGKGNIIFFSTNGSARIWELWRWPMAIRYSRIFKKIK